MRRTLIAIALLSALFCAGLARADVVQNGDVRAFFNASFSPHSLPRERTVPLTVHLQSKIRTIDGDRPPSLRRLVVAINRYGILSTKGLDTCSSSEIEQTTNAQARSRCGSSLVGRGRFRAFLSFEHRQPIPVVGHILVFNSVRGGRPALLLHVYVSSPVIVTLVLVTRITHSSDKTFGTVLTTTVPRIAAGLGYVTNLSLTLGRKYPYQGRQHSFLSGSCEAPVGLSGGIFSLARANFQFVNGQQMGTTLVRTCTVR